MDLTTTYLGLTLKSPLVVGAAGPLTEELGNIRWLEDSGAAAIVLHSLFEEQIRRERLELHHHLEHGTESFAEALTYSMWERKRISTISGWRKPWSMCRLLVASTALLSVAGWIMPSRWRRPGQMRSS